VWRSAASAGGSACRVLLCATFHTLHSRRPTHCTSCRYDDGLQDITNIDFVESVVRDMMRSNLRLRPRMRWLKMDMTRMDKARRPSVQHQDFCVQD
jgi:hypothetical protein